MSLFLKVIYCSYTKNHQLLYLHVQKTIKVIKNLITRLEV